MTGYGLGLRDKRAGLVGGIGQGTWGKAFRLDSGIRKGYTRILPRHITPVLYQTWHERGSGIQWGIRAIVIRMHWWDAEDWDGIDG